MIKRRLGLFSKLIIWAVTAVAVIVTIGYAVNAGPEDACSGAAADSPYCQSIDNPVDPVKDEHGTVRMVTDAIAYAAGFIGVFWLIIQAIKMATANGNSDKIASASKGMIYAVVGIIVVVVARYIINYALNKL